MKKLLSLVLLSVVALSFAKDIECYPNRVLVQLTENVNSELLLSEGELRTGLSDVDEFLKEIKASSVRPLYGFNDRSALAEELGMTKQYILDYSADIDEEEVAKKLSSSSNVVFAEPDYKYELDYNPTDSLVLAQWYLTKTKTRQAWDIQKGAEGVTIAIIDTGIKKEHRDLRNQLWENEAEVNGTVGVDDDGNGKVDDLIGWDFSDDDNTLLHDFTLPTGGEDHGTHCAGIAAAQDHTELTANTGIVGVGFNAKILTAKIFPNSFASVSSPAIRYAADMGAKVSSNSWGGAGASSIVSSAVNYSVMEGCVFIAAAGNDNISSPTHYPSGYQNAMSVGATDNYDNKAGFSNYGSWVTICAPGTSIWSTVDNTVSIGLDYDNWPGTSMATPIVAGAAALCIAKNGYFGNNGLTGVDSLRAVLENYGDEPNHDQIGLRLNVENSLNAVLASGVGIGDEPVNPESPVLLGNYPNPFNPETTIQFSLNKAGNVKMAVYNNNGALVKTLLNKNMSAGTHKVNFDGSNLTTGAYFYTLEVDGHKLSKQMLLIK